MGIAQCRICGYAFDSVESYKAREDVPDVYQCDKCQSVFRDTSDKDFKKIFSGLSANQKTIKWNFFRYLIVKTNVERVVQSFYYQWLKKRMDLGSIHNVLDIGCGDGTLMSLLLSQGCRVEGYEAYVAKFQYSKVKQFIHNDYFLINQSINGKYDLIVLGQCIYYFYDGIELLKYLDFLLTEKGKIFIATGNTRNEGIFYGMKEHVPTVLSYKIIDEFFTHRNCRVTGETFEIIQPKILTRVNGFIAGKFKKGIHLCGTIDFITAKMVGRYKKNIDGYHQFILIEKNK